MDAAGIQTRINAGYGKAARYLGQTCSRYRPSGTGNPLAGGNLQGTILAQFAADFGFSFRAPNLSAKGVYSGLFDRTNTLVGDYLVGPEGTFFIVTQQLLSPVACIQCNRVLTLKRPGAGAVGSTFYGGDVASEETTILTSWPAGVYQGAGRQVSDAELPADTRLPWWRIFLPVLPGGVQPMSQDIAYDDQAAPRRYIFSSCEQTDLGWSITAQQVGT